ncbi:DUF2062 domain-containing protein [Acidobacteriota bacterium]
MVGNARKAAGNKKNKILAKLQKVYNRFIRIQGDPRKIALGFALGIFFGMTPFLGLHIILAVFIAALLKWNKIWAALGVGITNPLSAPFVYTLNYYVGTKILGIDVVFILPEEYTFGGFVKMLKMTPELLLILTVGGLILSVPFTILGYFASYAAVTSYRRHIKAKLAEKKAFLSKKKEEIKRRIIKKEDPEKNRRNQIKSTTESASKREVEK